MTKTPDKEKRKSDRDNILLDALYNLVVYLPVLLFSWVVDKFSD